MPSTIMVASKTGVDAYGKASYAAPRAMRARVQQNRSVIQRGNGEEFVCTHTLYTLDPLTVTDLVWLPGADSTNVEKAYQPEVIHFTTDKAARKGLYRVQL